MKTKVFQVTYGDIPEAAEHCMESVKIYYPQVEVFRFPAAENPIRESDNFRIDRLMEADDILYIDWDILLTGKLDIIENGVPCCGYYKNAPDYSLIYSPKKEFWIAIEAGRRCSGISRNVYGWPRKLLRDKPINEITGNHKHLRLSHA